MSNPSDTTELSDPIPAAGPLSPAQGMSLCRGCNRCCTYVSVEVDAPNVPWMYDQYVWLLEHRGVWMYMETGNHWYVQFETVCEQLDAENRCQIHGRHPVLCKEYDARSCERRGELTKILARFHRGDDLVRWLEENRPVHYRRYRAWFDKAHAASHAPGEGAVQRYAMPPPPTSPFARAPGVPLTLRRVRPRGAAPRKA